MNKIKFLYTACLVIILSVTGCSEDVDIVPVTSEGTTFIIEVPEMEIPEKIRAVDDQVSRLDILVFESDILKQHAKVEQSLDLSNNNTVKVTVKLQQSGGCQFVIVANTPELENKYVIGNSKTTIFSDTNTLINATTYTSFKDAVFSINVPMYFESTAGQIIDTDDTKNKFNAALIRMSAQLKVSGLATEVKLYNAQTEGYLLPKYDSSKNPVINIPSSSSTTTVSMTVGSPVNILEANPVTSSIGNEPNRDVAKAAFLIVKAAYLGKEYYYPVDFTKVGTNNYMPILRNHLYDVTITEVKGKGYLTVHEAKEAYSVPTKDENEFKMIGFRTLEYDLDRVNNFVYNGQYYLGATNILAGWDTGSYNILVSSSFNPTDILDPADPDYKKDWTIDKIEYQTAVEGGGTYTAVDNPVKGTSYGWFKFTSETAGSYQGGAIPYKTVLKVELTKHDNDKATNRRTAKIYLTTGRLTLVILVEQNPKPASEFTISLDPYKPNGIVVPIDPQHNFRIYSNYINKPSNYNNNNELKVNGLPDNKLTFKMDTPFKTTITGTGIVSSVDGSVDAANGKIGQNVTVTFSGAAGTGSLKFVIEEGSNKTHFTYTLKFIKN